MQQRSIQFREATDSDRDVVFGLFAEVQSIHAAAEPEFFRQPENDDTFKKFFEHVLRDSDQHLVMACVDGIPVGYVQFFIGTRPGNLYRPDRSLAYISQLIVTKASRRTGCGTALIDHVKNEARQRNIPRVGIDFWSFNEAARACFAKSGFKVTQEFMWLRL